MAQDKTNDRVVLYTPVRTTRNADYDMDAYFDRLDEYIEMLEIELDRMPDSDHRLKIQAGINYLTERLELGDIWIDKGIVGSPEIWEPLETYTDQEACDRLASYEIPEVSYAKIEFRTDTAAFCDPEETPRIIREVTGKIESGSFSGNIRDINGNLIGYYSVED